MFLHLDGKGPRYAQITRALGVLIQSGALRPGSRVPATRELARDLGCSRNIVLLACEQLTLEGYLVTRPGAGTFVSPGLRPPRQPDPRGERSADDLRPLRLSTNGRRLARIAAEAREITSDRRRQAVDFVYGQCEPDERAVARIRGAFAGALRQDSFGYPNPAGDAMLRQQVAERLRGVRGIVRTADEIVITSGAQQALDICARLLLSPGDRVVVEEPGYEGAAAAFESAGATLVRVRVDANGLDPAGLPEDGAPVRLAYVTPSHQFPTGAVMPAARRYALLAWARRRGAYVIEDDYNGEFRYAGKSIAALSALDPDGPVIYCGTLAKSLCPSLRLGYLVLPASLVPAVVACKWLSDRGSPLLLQRTVAELMATGEYDRHIKRMLRRYRTRREALIAALHERLGSDVEVRGGTSGSHVAVWLPRLPLDSVPALIDGCKARGVGVYSIAGHATLPLERAGLMLGYGLLDVERINRGVKVLAEVYRRLKPTAVASK
jgi:GntR family transcriptional regulator / MocR family aminotransferase